MPFNESLLSTHAGTEIHAEAISRAARAKPKVPGINAGAVGPNVGTGKHRTSRDSRVAWGPIRSFRVRPTGGAIDPGRTTVVSTEEQAFIRARERGETALAERLDPARKAQWETILAFEIEWLSGRNKTDEIRDIVRVGYRAHGLIPRI